MFIEPFRCLHIESYWGGGPTSKRLERRAKATFDEDSWVYATRDLAQFLECARQLVGNGIEMLQDLVEAGRNCSSRSAQFESSRNKSLLRSIMDIAFDLSSGGIRGGDDAGTRSDECGSGLRIGDRGRH